MMVVELPMLLEAALKEQASARGMTAATYLREMLERELGSSIEAGGVRKSLTGRGLLAKYGPAPSAEEISKARQELWGGDRCLPGGACISLDRMIRAATLQTIW